MRARYLLLAACSAASGIVALGACATADDPTAAPSSNVVLTSDAGTDGDDAHAEDAASCVDCEYFQETCSDDVLCPNWPSDMIGTIDPRVTFTTIQGRSRADVWVAGALGSAAHHDGSAWTLHKLESAETIRALWLAESGEISGAALERLFTRGLAVADGGVAPGEDWTARTTVPHQEYARWSRTITSGWASRDAQWLWATTENNCFLDLGNSTRPIPGCATDTSPSSGLWRVRVDASSDVELADAIGKELCRAISCGSMTSVHGSTANALWAVGHAGAAIRVTDADSDTPKLRAFNSQTLNAIYGVWESTPPGTDGAGGEAWAVGAKGVIRHYKGDPAVWEVVEGPTTMDLRAVWGSSSSDVWAVGDEATVLHYDGTSWSRVKIAGLGARRPKLTAVWTAEPGHVWVAGHGVVLSLGGKP